MKVVVVAPHPDDEVLGCGGVMARHADDGAEVHVVVATRGIPELFAPELVARGRAELAEAHRILGVSETRFLDFPAPRLDTVPRHELADALRKVFYDLGATIVYLPHHGDIHADHGHVYHAGLVAARPLAGCPVRRVLCYETLSETEWTPPIDGAVFFPTVFVNIEKQLQRKLDAMACYKSQLKQAPNPRSLDVLRALAQLRGSTIHAPAAEAFELVREIWD
jgi:LmbE family N-acetylglucosaminyl deacetylase